MNKIKAKQRRQKLLTNHKCPCGDQFNSKFGLKQHFDFCNAWKPEGIADPKGMQTCKECFQRLEINKFYEDVNHVNGVKSECKNCISRIRKLRRPKSTWVHPVKYSDTHKLCEKHGQVPLNECYIRKTKKGAMHVECNLCVNQRNAMARNKRKLAKMAVQV
jgi:hypothetical protein